MKPIKHSAPLLLTLASLFAPSAQAETPIKAQLAQCTIDSYGDAGRHFLEKNKSPKDRDEAYRNWMLLCMEAKGFTYDIKACPLMQDGALKASDPGCYKRM